MEIGSWLTDGGGRRPPSWRDTEVLGGASRGSLQAVVCEVRLSVVAKMARLLDGGSRG